MFTLVGVGLSTCIQPCHPTNLFGPYSVLYRLFCTGADKCWWCLSRGNLGWAAPRCNIHGVDPNYSLGKAIFAFCGNPDAAGTILGVESIYGAVDTGSPFAGIKVQRSDLRPQGPVKRGQTRFV
jgi:hypothetical protein